MFTFYSVLTLQALIIFLLVLLYFRLKETIEMEMEFTRFDIMVLKKIVYKNSNIRTPSGSGTLNSKVK